MSNSDAILESPSTPGQGRGADVEELKGVCFECRQSLPNRYLLRFMDESVCYRCKPRFFQRLREGQDISAGRFVSGLSERFVAKALDGILMGLGFVPVLAIIGAVREVTNDSSAPLGIIAAQLLIPAAYNTFFVAYKEATPGKWLVGLKVVTDSGGRVGVGQALVRHFAEWFVSMSLGIGYLLAFVDRERRTLHDRIAGTKVIRRAP